MINRETFFTSVRPMFGGSLSSGQVDGMTRVLDEWERRGLTDPRWLAYMLATDKWETASTMQPVREMGGEAYLKKKKYYPWVGEGLVQVTWEANARKFGATAPGQLLSWPKALGPLFDGMINGMFTGKKLADFFNDNVTDWAHARKIINGMDKADDIATLAKQFYAAIMLALVVTSATPAPPVPAPEPPAKPMAKSPINWAQIGAGAGGALVALPNTIKAVQDQVITPATAAAQAAKDAGGQISGLWATIDSPITMAVLGVAIIGAAGFTIYRRFKIAREQGV